MPKDMAQHYSAWVAEDGSYGGKQPIILFSPDSLTDQQWELLDTLGDNDKFAYVKAIMSGEPLHEWEECEHPNLKHAEGDATIAFCPDCELEFRCMCEECVY